MEKAAKSSPVSHVFVRGSIGDKALVDELFQTYHFDIVVNLAAQAGVRYSIDHPDVYIESNIIGFYNLLEACRHNPVEHLVYASTKKSDELLAHAYSKLYNIPSTGLRFFTVYGPAGRPDMFYYSATQRLVAGKTIQISGFCISGILFAMGASHKPFAKKTGYDEVKLVIGTPAGDITFSRKYSSNLIEVISDNAEIEDDTYTTQYNTDRTPINDVWLKLMGIEELPMLASNKRSVKKRMTWNNLMRLFYIDEMEICREESIIEPTQYTEKTLLLSAIRYLVYGKNFASDMTQQDSAVRKAKNEIMEEYLNKHLSAADSQLKRLQAYADSITDMRLHTELQKTAESQKGIEGLNLYSSASFSLILDSRNLFAYFTKFVLVICIDILGKSKYIYVVNQSH